MSEIFRAYDIRGIYPSQLNEDLAYRIGRAFVTFLKVKKVVVGRDARHSSAKLHRALIRGIIDQGARVIDIKLCSTPMFYFASRKAQSSIMITASHLPKKYNGFKLCREKAIPISKKDGLKQIQKLVEKNSFKKARKGKVIHKNILIAFVRFNLKFFKGKKQLKVVLDAGNGMSGYTLPRIFEQIDALELILQHCNLDFSFPNHIPDPLKFETLKALQKRVRKEHADFGLATDGDGDRCVFVGEKGQIISPDLAVALLAQQLLKQHSGAKIMYDVRCSQIVKETIEREGGKAIMSRVGHSFIKKKMRKEKILFAGELSGHLYYQANNYTESPSISTALLINLLAETGQPLSALVKPLRKYYHSGEINRKVKDKDKIIKKVEKKYRQKAKKTLYLDGLSMYFKDWWFNLRESHTEDLLRLNLEAKSKKLMEIKKDELLQILRSS